MKSWIVAAAATLLFGVSQVASAFPLAEASCLAGGCLKSGWTVYDNLSKQTGLIQCLDEDCGVHGWTEEIVGQGPGYRSECHPEGCFERGWETYNILTGEFVSRTTCYVGGRDSVGNCLTAGWIVRPVWGRPTMFSCVDRDCANKGWRITLPDGGRQQAICKQGGCFERGWVIDGR